MSKVLPTTTRAPMAGALSPVAAQLAARAAGSRTPATTWVGSSSWEQARNAHVTNTAAELGAAIAGGYNWFEGDVRFRDDGVAVMAHEPRDIPVALSLREWLAIGARSGRGIKVELKQPQVFAVVLAELERSGIDQSRLIINVPVAGAEPHNSLTDAQLVELRRRFPRATVNLAAADQMRLGPAVLAALARAARIVGGNVMFPIQWDLLSPEVIRALRPFGRIAVWTSSWGAPGDVARETARLRAMGVDGMIDLESATLGSRFVSLLARGVGAIIGRQALYDARDAGIALRDAILPPRVH